MVFLDLPLQPTVVLDTAQASIDLLERRSRIYSDRRKTVMDELYVMHRVRLV